MEEVIDYIENLYSDYYQNQDNKSLEEIRALALAKLKAEHNSEYKSATPQSFDKESYMNWCVASGIPANMAEGIFERFIK